MKYRNANDILPSELLENIQQYIQGEYIYIPIKDKIEKTTLTEYELELQKRDERIYLRHLEGIAGKRLAEMYNLSDSSIRRIIINQRKRYEDMQENIRSILKKWNIDTDDKSFNLEQIYDSAWQVGEQYILKVYDDINMLERNIKLITILDNMNIPVGRIIPTVGNMNFARDEEHYYMLNDKLRGKNIVSIKGNARLAYDMGDIIAKLHLAFRECEEQDEFWDNSLLAEMRGWVRESLSGNGWKYISKEEYDDVVSKLEKLYDKLPAQLIHRDVHFGNFLFDEGKFSGYIDFDLSQRNIRIFDLCYFLLGLLSEEGKLEVTENDWFEVLRNVFGGYEHSIKLSEEEKQAVPYVMMSIELLFVAWFVGQDDVKCAENAMDIYRFVLKNVQRIWRYL